MRQGRHREHERHSLSGDASGGTAIRSGAPWHVHCSVARRCGNFRTSWSSWSWVTGGLFSGVFRIDVDQVGGAISHAPPKQPLDAVTQGYFIPNNNPRASAASCPRWLATSTAALRCPSSPASSSSPTGSAFHDTRSAVGETRPRGRLVRQRAPRGRPGPTGQRGARRARRPAELGPHEESQRDGRRSTHAATGPHARRSRRTSRNQRVDHRRSPVRILRRAKRDGRGGGI